MFSTFFPNSDQVRKATLYGKLALFLGLATFIETAVAYPQLLSNCFEICDNACKRYGFWTATDNCTIGELAGEVITLQVKTCDKLVNGVKVMTINADKIDPAANFTLLGNKGTRCECIPDAAMECETIYRKR